MKSPHYRPRDFESRWQERWQDRAKGNPAGDPMTAEPPVDAPAPAGGPLSQETKAPAGGDEGQQGPAASQAAESSGTGDDRAVPASVESSPESPESPASQSGEQAPPDSAAEDPDGGRPAEPREPADKDKKRKKARPKTHYVYPVPISGGLGRSPASTLRRMIAADVYGRLQRLMGASVYSPVGLALWDRDLARESVDNESMPEEYLEKHMSSFEGLLAKFGVSVNAFGKIRDNDPSYYRWTQWLFLQLLRRRQLRYSDGSSKEVEEADRDAFRARREAECIDNPSWDAAVEPLEFALSGRFDSGWYVDVTAYGDRLLSDLGKSNWLLDDRNAQRYRIGRLRGCRVILQVSNRFRLDCDELEVFTTRVETIYGATYVLVHPWHPIVERIIEPGYEDDIENYRNRIRQGNEPRVSGVRTGGYGINPINLERMPVLVSRLAMEGERTSAILGVPAHEAVMFDLARRTRLPIREVVRGAGSQYDVNGRLVAPFIGEGVMTNSGKFNSMPQKAAREKVIQFFTRRANCLRTTQFFLSGFPISERSAWGVPVPIIHCPDCGIRPVPEHELPVPAPTFDVERLRSELETGTDLSHVEGFSNVSCPACGAAATRDSHVIADWLGRAWMFLRHLAPELADEVTGTPPAEQPVHGASEATDATSDAVDSEDAGDEDFRDEDFGEGEDAERSEGTASVKEPAGTSASHGPAPDASPPDSSEEKAPGVEAVNDASNDGVSETGEVRAERVASSSHVAASASPESASPESAVPSESDADSGTETAASDAQVSADASSTKDPSNEDQSNEDQPNEDQPDEERSTDVQSEHGDTEHAKSENESNEKEGDDPEASDPEASASDAEGSDAKGDRTSGDDTRASGTGGRDDKSSRDADSGPRKLFDAPSTCRPFRKPTVRKWLPVDTGVGPVGGGVSGILQTRFLTKFLYDLREISCYEPFYRFARVGAVASPAEWAPSENGAESSDERQLSPERLEELAAKYGADSMRLYLLSQVPLSATLRFNEHDLWSIHRLLRRIWNEVHVRLDEGKFVSRRLLVAKHRLIDELTRVMRRFHFLKAVSAVYTFVNFLANPETTKEEMDRSSIQTFVVLLWPLVPHLASELWIAADGEGDIEDQPWPEASDELLHPTEVEVPVQVDNRVVARITVPAGLSKENFEDQVLGDTAVQNALAGRPVSRVIASPDRIVNILLEPEEPGEEAETSE